MNYSIAFSTLVTKEVFRFIRTLHLLVPKPQLGNPEGEALASRNGKLELPRPNSQAGAWELAIKSNRLDLIDSKPAGAKQ